MIRPFPSMAGGPVRALGGGDASASAPRVRIAMNMESVRIGADDYPVTWAYGDDLAEIERKISQRFTRAQPSTQVIECELGFTMPLKATDPNAGEIFGGTCMVTDEGVTQRFLVAYGPAPTDIAVRAAAEVFGPLGERKELIRLVLSRFFQD